MTGNSVTEIYKESLPTFFSRSTCTQKADCIMRVRFETKGVNHLRQGSDGAAVGDYLSGENFLLFSYKGMLKDSLTRVQDVREKKVGSVYVYEIRIRSESIALFVWLSFPDDSIRGSFDRNGFIAFEPDQVVHFSSFNKYSPTLIGDKITIQTLN